MPTNSPNKNYSHQPGGREYLANLQDGAHLLSESHTFVQGIVAVILGSAWWFGGLVEVLSAPESGGVSTLVMLMLALPTLGIVLVWVYSFDWLQKYLYPRYLECTRAVFRNTDLTVQLLGPELPEQIAKILKAPAQSSLQPSGESAAASFAQRIEQTRRRYPALAEALGHRPYPRPWGAVDAVLLPLLALSVALMLMLAHTMLAFQVFLAVTLFCASLKYVLFTVRQCAIRVVLGEVLGGSRSL